MPSLTPHRKALSYHVTYDFVSGGSTGLNISAYAYIQGGPGVALSELCERSGDIAREEKERSGRLALGTLCSYVPVEILHSFGILPVRIWGQSVDIQAADVLMQPYICPPVRHLMALGLEGGYDWLDGIVHCYTCDATCGLYNIWVRNLEPRFSRLISLPYMDIPESITYARAEMESFIAELESFTGRDFSADALLRSLALYNRGRSYTREAYRLKARGAALSYADLYYMDLSLQVLPVETALPKLEEALDAADAMYTAAGPDAVGDQRPQGRGGPRILLSGGVISDTVLMAYIEQCGGDIVADDTCLGYRLVRDAFARDDGGDPLEDLIRYYLRRTPCASRSDFPSRKFHLLEMLEESGIDAVVFVHQKFCDPHLSDYPYLKKVLAAEGIPSLQLELEGDSFNAQMQTRIESFFETLGAK